VKIYQVRQALWNRGYKVNDFSDSNLGFDLLVEKRYKVRVQEMGEYLAASEDYIVAEVSKGRGVFKGKVGVFYKTPKISTNVPQNVFGFNSEKSKDKNYGKKEGKKSGKKTNGKT
jgi:hypothetical protein